MLLGASTSTFGWMRNGSASNLFPVLIFVTLSISCALSSAHHGKPSDVETAALQALGLSDLKFANSLYKILSQEEGNLFFSPISIEVILALTYFGARGETASQIAKGLHLPADDAEIEFGFKKLIRLLKSDKNITLDIANKIFTDNSIKLEKEFTTLAQKSFDSSIKGVDFQENTEAARLQINRWVEEKTNQKIKDLLKKGIVTANTAVVLINAIYFKSDWALKFNASNTRNEKFFVTPTQSKIVQMMNSRAAVKFGVSKELDSKVLELMYEGDQLSLMVILPRKLDGLTTLETNAPHVDLMKLLDNLEKLDVEVSLPKFKLEQFIDLNAVLKKLGIVDMFGQNADLSGLTKTPVTVSDVIHKAVIEVDENGSEASAATAVLSDRRSIPHRFEANHPFVFAIIDKRLKAPIFVGRYAV